MGATSPDRRIDRLHWRAGFGPAAADRARGRRLGVGGSVEAMLHARGRLVGHPPVVRENGVDRQLDPGRNWGDDVLWWLDRMVRTTAPLAERMALNLHDHFATSNDKVGDAGLMLDHYRLLRRHALGNFGTLAHRMLHDPAMQWWLDLLFSNREQPNENFARELMELFTLGVGTYTERDVREAARALTGFTYDWETKAYGFDATAHDAGRKTIFGHTGTFGPDDVVRLCLEHRAHAPYICTKLWGYYVPTPPPAAVLRRLVHAYRASGREIAPVLRIVLTSTPFYAHLDDPDLVKPPVVYLVGMLRRLRPSIRESDWVWLLDRMGQVPFYPPNVGGWPSNGDWLTTLTNEARFQAAAVVVGLDGVRFADTETPTDEGPTAALRWALAETGRPFTTPVSRRTLARVAASIKPEASWDHHARSERRRVLRHLLLAGPDAQVH